jgi:hypothetical protein
LQLRCRLRVHLCPGAGLIWQLFAEKIGLRKTMDREMLDPLRPQLEVCSVAKRYRTGGDDCARKECGRYRKTGR